MKSQSHRPTVRPSVFLGGDAGGSHSAVAIGREDGTVLGRAEGPGAAMRPGGAAASVVVLADIARRAATQAVVSLPVDRDRKSTRLNSSHVRISYAVFCLKKKKKNH